MKTSQRKKSLLGLVLSCLLLSLVPIATAAEAAVPEPQAIGRPASKLAHWIRSPAKAVYPDSIQLDLKEGTIAGIVCEYSAPGLSYAALRDQLTRTLKVRPRLSDATTSAWRLEKPGCAVMLNVDSEAKVLRLVLRAFSNTGGSQRPKTR